MTQTVVPEGRGKAKALETFLAGGGGLLSRGGTRNPQFRYQEGRLRGKTHEEGLSVFESLWAGVNPRVKDKYARMAGVEGTLSPSEMEELGTGTNPQPGVEYGTGKVAGIQPTPAGTATTTNTAPATTTVPATTTATEGTPATPPATATTTDSTAAPMGAQEKRMKFYADQKAARMAYYAPAPQLQRKAATSTPAASTSGTAAATAPASTATADTTTPVKPQPVGRTPLIPGITPGVMGPPDGATQAALARRSGVIPGIQPTPAGSEAPSTPAPAASPKPSAVQRPLHTSLGGALLHDVRGSIDSVNKSEAGGLANIASFIPKKVQSVVPGETGRFLRDMNPAGKLQDSVFNALRAPARWMGVSEPATAPVRASVQPPAAQPKVTEVQESAAATSDTTPQPSKLAQYEIAKRKLAVAHTPDGAPVMDRKSAVLEGVATGRRVNRLTGLPFGFQPGDKLPDGADDMMNWRAEASAKRQEIADSKAAMTSQGKPFSGMKASQPATAAQPTGYAGPKTRYTPGMGEVAVAQPVTNGDEKISYGQYDQARTRTKTAGSTVEQDRKDRAMQQEYERQANAARRKPGGAWAGDYAKDRLVTR